MTTLTEADVRRIAGDEWAGATAAIRELWARPLRQQRPARDLLIDLVEDVLQLAGYALNKLVSHTSSLRVRSDAAKVGGGRSSRTGADPHRIAAGCGPVILPIRTARGGRAGDGTPTRGDVA